MTTSVHVQQRRYAVLDVLRQHPTGITKADIAATLGVDVDAVDDDIRALRRDSTIDNIPARSNGHNQPWLYRLTNESDDNEWWARNRVRDQESRFRTEIGMAATLVRVTDGRSVVGRKARKIERVLVYLMNELADLEPQLRVGL